MNYKQSTSFGYVPKSSYPVDHLPKIPFLSIGFSKKPQNPNPKSKYRSFSPQKSFQKLRFNQKREAQTKSSLGIYQLPQIERPCQKPFKPNKYFNTRFYSINNHRYKQPLEIKGNFFPRKQEQKTGLIETINMLSQQTALKKLNSETFQGTRRKIVFSKLKGGHKLSKSIQYD